MKNAFEQAEKTLPTKQNESSYEQPPKYFPRERTSYQTSSLAYHSNVIQENSTDVLLPLKSKKIEVIDDDLKYSNQLVCVGNEFCITKINDIPVVINSSILLTEYLEQLLSKTKIAESKSLLFPSSIDLVSDCLEEFDVFDDLESIGFVCEPIVDLNLEFGKLLIKKIPLWLLQKESHWIFDKLPLWLEARVESRESFIRKILEDIKEKPLRLIDFLIQRMNDELMQSNCCKQLTNQKIQELFK